MAKRVAGKRRLAEHKDLYPAACSSGSESAAEELQSPSKGSIKRQIRRLGRLAEDLGCEVSAVVGTVLAVWCSKDFPALPRANLPFSKPLASEANFQTFVELLRPLSFLEATYWLSSTYAILSKEDYRKELAMYFTPVSLTRGLLDDLAKQGVDFGSQSFLDPACGGAAFLAPIALRMRSALLAQGKTARQILKHAEAHLRGTDVDKSLCELSKHFLCMALHREIQQSGYQPKFDVAVANSLEQLNILIGTIDVVVCNPPYRKMTAAELEPLRPSFADVIEAQPNLYGLFTSLCVRLLRQGGLAALVTPTSFLSGQYFSKLRKFLMRHTDIEHIGMVSDRSGVFIDVEQETALTVLRRRVEVERKQVRAKVSVVSGGGIYQDVGECLLPNGGAVWPIPRSIEDVALLRAALKSRFRLADYGYRVRIGAYVWNRDKRPKYESIKDVRRAKSRSAMPLLWSRDISANGTVHFDGSEMSGDEHRFVDLGDKRHSSVVTRPSVVIQRVTSNDQPRRLVAGAVPKHVFDIYGGFVGENHVVILEQEADKPALSPAKLAKLLASRPVERYFRCISGATNVSAFELRQLVLPDPEILKSELKRCTSMEEAVVRSYKCVT
jgi:adenine-specific DNA-methyltransferase